MADEKLEEEAENEVKELKEKREEIEIEDVCEGKKKREQKH